MAYKKLVADGKTICAFNDRLYWFEDDDPVRVNPEYIEKILDKKLSGVEVRPATGEEYKKYKRTRRKKATSPENLPLF